jgi:hypothetical protein
MAKKKRHGQRDLGVRPEELDEFGIPLYEDFTGEGEEWQPSEEERAAFAALGADDDDWSDDDWDDDDDGDDDRDWN